MDAALEAQIEETAQDVRTNSQTLPATAKAKNTMSHERLAQFIQAHQGALLAHPEAQDTHEAIINLLQGVDSGEITIGQCVRLLRYQAMLAADVPTFAKLYRQAVADLQQMQREERWR